MNGYWLRSPDICGEQYENFIRYALAHSDAFQLVVSNKPKGVRLPAGSKAIMTALRRDRIGGWSKTGDYSLPMTEGTTREGCYCTTVMLQASPRSYDQLVKPRSLFGWLAPDYPEDLSFFRDGYCWLATCSHEGIAWLCAEQDEVRELQRLTGACFEADGPCSVEELFHEAYRLRGEVQIGENLC